jgi:putative transposon-encoded protein
VPKRKNGCAIAVIVTAVTAFLFIGTMILLGSCAALFYSSNNVNQGSTNNTEINSFTKIPLPTIDASKSIGQTFPPPSTINPDYTGLEIAKLTERINAIGTPEIKITVKNNTKQTIDAFSFVVECKDIYGESIRAFDFGDEDAAFLIEEKIKPGKTSKKNMYCTLYGYERASIYSVAIYKYHTTNGDTIEIPIEYLGWKTYK